jgi:hypothetical protein
MGTTCGAFPVYAETTDISVEQHQSCRAQLVDRCNRLGP